MLNQLDELQKLKNEMQKDPRAKGLDLNVMKVEVPEDMEE